ncbi:MAG: hypothetical protein IPL40_08435 [Proteobacteria bacterium]|nr:hypothetical protein [Pseudomonadota bacterium]
MSAEQQQPPSPRAAAPVDPPQRAGDASGQRTVDEAVERLSFGRRSGRHPLVSVAVIALSLYLTAHNWHELRYFFAARTAVDLGEARAAARRPSANLMALADHHVRVEGVPDRKHALLLEGRFGGQEHFYRLMGADDRLFAHWSRAPASATAGEAKSLPGVHVGRLVPLDRLGYASAVRDYLARSMSVAHDFDFGPLQAASTGGKAAAVDRQGRSVALTAGMVFWINVAFADEWIVQLPRRSYARVEEADALLARLALPHVRDTEPSTTAWRYVVVARGAELQRLLQGLHGIPTAGALLRRQIGYTARWDQLRWDATTLTLALEDATAPPRYARRPAVAVGGPAELVPVRGQPLRFSRDELLYLSTSTPFSVPARAMVVLAGETPGKQWPYALLQLLLLSFIAANAWVLLRTYRASHRRGA